MRVKAEVEEVQIEGDYGALGGTVVTCSRCGHFVEIGGQGDGPAMRGAARLRDECPRGEQNYYLLD